MIGTGGIAIVLIVGIAGGVYRGIYCVDVVNDNVSGMIAVMGLVVIFGMTGMDGVTWSVEVTIPVVGTARVASVEGVV